jgi:exosortase A-associated hydrolase 2
MNSLGPVVESAGFVPGASGYRFRLVCEPEGGAPRGTVILAHAFAEEMNKSRRMCARLARRLAAEGWRVVRKDLLGCGDSSGDFRDASWAAWLDDLDVELAQADPASPVWLWCVRGGALLAPALLAKHPNVDLLLWQPATSGAQHLQQFLRLHSGARIVGSAKATAASTPLQRLHHGETVEVAGYGLGPALAEGLEQAKLELPAAYTGRVAWLAVSDTGELTPVAEQWVERWRVRGTRVSIEALVGPAFWQTQEIEECPALLDRSCELLRSNTPARARGAGAESRAAAERLA